MDIKPSSSTIAALGQQAKKTADLTKTTRKQGQASDAAEARIRAKKASKNQSTGGVGEVGKTSKTSTKIEVQAAQARVGDLTTLPEFRREAPLAIAGPPKFQKMGQIVDIKV